MKATKSLVSMAVLMLAAGLVLTFSACEKDKDTNQQAVDEFLSEDYVSQDRDSSGGTTEDLAISPSSASIDTIGEKISFGVRGGNKPYTWSVSDSTAGTVSPTSTKNDIEQVVYTAAKLAKNTVVVTDALGRAAVVDVDAGTKTLSISPTTVSFLATELGGKNVQVQFQASGGVSTYTWTDSLVGYGDIDGNGLWTSDAAQTATTWSNKTVTITLTDSAGSSVTATIIAN